MHQNPRKVLFAMIAALTFLLVLWMDNLYLKQLGLLDYRYELIKILLNSMIAYKMAKYIIGRLKIEDKFNSITPNTIFILTFLILNSYIIIQYSSKVISNRIINREIRNELDNRTIKLQEAGWGYECDSMSYKQFRELIKDTNLPNIPEESSSIFVYDWYEINFQRIIKFNLNREFDLGGFYDSDTSTLNLIDRLEYEYDTKTGKSNKLDTSENIRYKWEAGES